MSYSAPSPVLRAAGGVVLALTKFVGMPCCHSRAFCRRPVAVVSWRCVLVPCACLRSRLPHLPRGLGLPGLDLCSASVPLCC